MNTTETELMKQLIEEVRELREEQKSFKGSLRGLSRRFLLILQRFETEIDLLKDRMDWFVKLLGIFEKLTRKIRTAFMESRIWEEVEEYRKNEGKKKRERKTETGFDVQRKPGKSD